ncbi:hypothetical protein, partial [Bordetella pertussis]
LYPSPDSTWTNTTYYLAVGLDRPGLAREGRQARGARVGEGRKRARAGVRAPGREASGQHGWRHGRHGW